MNRCPRIGLLTPHWPEGPTDSAGVFVKRWAERFQTAQVERGVKAAWHADVIAAHWLRWAGVIGYVISIVRNKPLWLVLYGDPYMIDKYWWVRWLARPIVRRAAAVQVLSIRCETLTRKRFPKAKIVRIPCV